MSADSATGQTHNVTDATHDNLRLAMEGEAMMRFFLWLGGGSDEVLARCPSEHAKISALGGAVATTSLLAGLAATSAARGWLHLPLAASVLLGMFWALSIMNLDRWLLVTIRRQATPARTALLALPRLLLAVVVGLVISEPLTQTVFRGEINAQALQDKQSALAQARAKLGTQYKQMGELEKQQDRLRGAATAGAASAALADSPDYAQLTDLLHEQQSRLEPARHAAICELDGVCGTRHRGAGPSYRAKEQTVSTIQGEVDATKRKLSGLETTLLSEAGAASKASRSFARSELGGVESDLRELRSQYRQNSDGLAAAYAAPVGLLDRVEALQRLTDAHPSLQFIVWLLTGFILLVDAVPVLFKTLTLLGRASMYEQLQDELERRQLRRRAIEEDRREALHDLENALLVEESQMHHKLQREVLTERAQRLVELEREMTGRMIPELRDRMRAGLPQLVTHYLRRHELPLDSTQLWPEADEAPNGVVKSHVA